MIDYIDLNIVEKKLKDGLYQSTFEFIADVEKVFTKGIRYLEPDNLVSNVIAEMRNHLE